MPMHRLTFVPKLFPCSRQRKCAKGPRKEAPTGWDLAPGLFRWWGGGGGFEQEAEGVRHPLPEQKIFWL